MIEISQLPHDLLEDIASSLGWEGDDDKKPLSAYLYEISVMSPKKALDCYLTWHGIIGYGTDIWNAAQQLKSAEDTSKGEDAT